MPSIDITGWKQDYVGFTGWDPYAVSELKRRLRRGIQASQSDLRRLARQIRNREPLTLRDVRDDSVYEITQLLQSTGAEFHVSRP
jgi:hypothetical protein